MPIKTVYVFEESPHDDNLPVFQELPAWAKEKLTFGSSREAYGVDYDGNFRTFYFCGHCGGWIEGHEKEHEVNTLNTHRLSGRHGTEYYCIRCGKQTHFFGIMS